MTTDAASTPPSRAGSTTTSAPAPASEGALREPSLELGGDLARYRWVALGLLVGAYFFNFVDRSIVNILAEPIKRDLGMSDAQIGLLTGFAFAVFYATLGIPIARLSDRTSRAKVIAVCLFLWSLMTALCGAARSFTVLLLCRIGVGVGEAGCSPPAHSMISDYFPPQRRATALGIYSLGIQIGVMFGFLAGGWINQFFGWRLAFVAVGLPGLLYAFVLLAFLREPPRGLADGRVAEGARAELPPVTEVFRLLWSRRSFRHLSIGGSLHAFVAYGVGGWLPPFYMRTHGMESGEVGTWVALLAGVVGSAGIFLGGYVADRLGVRDRRWYAWVCALSLVISLPFSIPAMLVGSPYVSLACYLVPAFMSPVYNAPNFAMTQGLVPLSMRAAAAAVLLFILNLIGMGLGPTLVGALSDSLRPAFGASSLRYALLLTTLVNLWAATHYLFAARTLRQDLDLAKVKIEP